MAKTKKTSLPPQIIEMGKSCEVKVNLIHKERGSAIRGKSLDGFLGAEKQILRDWDVESVTVILPTEVMIDVTYQSLEEETNDDNGGVE